MANSLLSPVDAATEVMTGVVMALTVSVSLYAASAHPVDAHGLVAAVVGGNVASGLFDGLLYLFAAAATRARRRTVVSQLRAAPDLATLEQRLGAALGEPLADVAPYVDLTRLRQWLAEAENPVPAPAALGEDLRGALLIMLAEIAPALCVVIPVLLMENPDNALRVSSALGLALLSVTGARVARWNGQPIWLLSVVAPTLGAILVFACLKLGG